RVVREVAEAVRAVRDRQPSLCSHLLRGRVELGAEAVHLACLDPLERRASATERDEVELGVVDVPKAVPATPVLKGIEVEAENVRGRHECRIHAAALWEWGGLAVEVIRQGEKTRTGAGHGRNELLRLRGGQVSGQMRVPLVG